MRNFRVLVNGNEYKVAIEELEDSVEAPQEIRPATSVAKPTAARSAAGNPPQPAAGDKSAAGGDSPGNIKAAMPGTILDVKVSVGDAVTRGQALLVLEAMKMENEIMAPHDGVINEVGVAVGASVNSGDLLVVMS